MKKHAAPHSALASRVERALALARKAQLNFPGIFMNLAGRQVGKDGLSVQVADDPVLSDARGELHWPALGVLVDVTLGAATRLVAGPAKRPATVRLDVQMTGASVRGAVATHAQFVQFSQGTAIAHALSRGTVQAAHDIVAHASGAFVLFDLPPGTTQRPQPWLPESLARAPLERVTLEANEKAALEMCRRAEAAASARHAFIEHFWCGIAKASEGEAELTVEVTPHLGNRVGQVHGGILLGAAASVATAAVAPSMRLSNITAWFVSPGLGPRLEVRSTALQQGRSLSVVRTQIVSAEGKLVLEATSQHVARAGQGDGKRE